MSILYSTQYPVSCRFSFSVHELAILFKLRFEFNPIPLGWVVLDNFNWRLMIKFRKLASYISMVFLVLLVDLLCIDINHIKNSET